MRVPLSPHTKPATNGVQTYYGDDASITYLNSPLKIQLPLRHDCYFFPESLQYLDVVRHARLLVVHLVPHRLQFHSQ